MMKLVHSILHFIKSGIMHPAMVIYSLFLLTGSGCICQSQDKAANSPNGPVNISVNTSRLGGVAPLSVFFDATGTSGLGLTDESFFSDNANYMDATFAWDFDADNYDPDGKYEKGSGFVAAHVFEHPGIYRVHLDVYDATGESASTDINITVSGFNGNTYYVASNGSDSNEGTIDHPFLTPEHALSSSVLAPDVRVLFRNGDTFTIARQLTVSDETGPIFIGSYSDLNNPSDVRPVIYITAMDSDWSTIHFVNCRDIRITGIGAMAGGESGGNPGPRYPYGITWDYACVNMLKYRTEEYQNGGMAMSPRGQYAVVAECDFHNTTETGYASNGEGVNDSNAIIGNHVYDKNLVDTEHIEHVFRLEGGSRFYIANNTFGPNILVSYDAVTIRGNSEKVVIYKNKMIGWVQNVRPANPNSGMDYQHHVIFDSNQVMGQGLYENDRLNAFAIHAKDIVIRNNIVYDYQIGVVVNNDTVVGPSCRIKIYNNTFVNPTAGSSFCIIDINAACSSIDIKNNLMLDTAGANPRYTSFLGISNGSIFNGESDSNLFYGGTWNNDILLFNGLTIAQWRSSTGNDLNSVIADPLLLSTDCNDEDFCKPGAGSQVVDKGEFTPAALDYYGNMRNSARDIGACEYVSE